MERAARLMVRSRAGSRCEYCLLPSGAVFFPFNIEHIIARQHGGGDDLENLALACDRCNQFKGPNLTSIDPESGNLVRLYHPRRDLWNDHFGLVGAEIVGYCEIGRATVTLLKMNSEMRLRIRQRLLNRGEFGVPPS